MTASVSLNKPTMLGTAALAVGLIAVMLGGFVPVPRALAISSLPWKVELISGLFCICLALIAPSIVGEREFSRHSRTIASLGGAFIFWSIASALWAPSFGWTVHHTLVWAVYIAILGTLVRLDRGNLFRGAAAGFGVVAIILAADPIV